MKEALTGIFVAGVFMYTLSLIGWASIVAESVSMNGRHAEHCEKTYRFDYVFPAKALGCWLGQEVQ